MVFEGWFPDDRYDRCKTKTKQKTFSDRSNHTVFIRLKELRHRSCILKKIVKLFKIVISNPFQSSPSSAILVPFCFRINHLVFFFLSKPLFLGFPTL